MSWPKLSETLLYERHPWVCQACGLNLFATPSTPHQLHRECDDKDKPTRTVVALCAECAGKLIEPHPRLYQQEPENKPVPGAMPHLCAGCRWRVALDCSHPKLTANGGPGLLITIAKPARFFWDGRDKKGRRIGGLAERFPSPATRCEGAEPPGEPE